MLGDFLAVLWLISQSAFPVSFYGAQFDAGSAAPIILFDIALFIILVHYGWHLGSTPRLRTRAYFLTVGIITGVVSFAHLMRIFTGVDIVILTWSVPLWISYIATIAAAYLSYMSFYLSVRSR